MMLRCMDEAMLHSEVPRGKTVAAIGTAAGDDDEKKKEDAAGKQEGAEGGRICRVGCRAVREPAVDFSAACLICAAAGTPVRLAAVTPACPARVTRAWAA